MAMTRTCQQCGTVLPGRAAAWLCPKCLLQQAATPVDFIAGAPSQPDATALPRAIHYFGDYELRHEIARGGMGVVYKARQVSLNRTVAVKMLLYGKLAGGDYVKRFRAEAEAAASLQHPNIVAIHEVGEHEGQQYFSMDYIEGSDLAALVREKPLPARRAAAYLKIIAEAIHYAHQRGILHRDLKPSNILIDTNDQPRVTDFGLAKRLPSTQDSRGAPARASAAAAGLKPQDLTVSGQVLGSPSYMPPEQAGGKRGEITPASDVYSLGAILYHLLTGRPPFLADTLEAALTQLLHNDPVSPRLLNASVPRDLEIICLKCLSKEPQRRYDSAKALAEDLGRWLGGKPVQARPASLGERLWSWCRRKPALAISIAIIHLIGAVGLVGILWQWRRAETYATVATANLRESYLAQAQALRVSSKAGRKQEALEAIAKASKIQPSPSLRNEAIASLAQADLRLASIHAINTDFGSNETFDPSFTLSAVITAPDRIAVQHTFSREPVAEIRLARGAVSWVRKFSANSRYLALDTSLDGTCIWDFSRQSFALSGLPGDTRGDFEADNQVFVIGNQSNGISWFDLSTGKELRRIGKDFPIQGVALDPSGEKLACWNHDRLEIIDASTGEQIHHLEPQGHFSRAVWFNDGQMLAAAGPDHGVYVWNVATGRLVHFLLGHPEGVISVAVSPTGEFMATSSFDETMRLWDLLTGRPLAVVPGAAWNLTFSMDGRFLGPVRVGTSNCVFEVIRPTGFRRLTPPIPETGAQKVHAMDFSPDGRFIAAAAVDGVRLWDRVAGRFLAKLPTAGACSAVFDPDGTALLISADGKFSRWPLRLREENGTNALLIGPGQPIGPDGHWSFAVLGRRSATLALASVSEPAAITSLRASTNWLRLEKVHEGGQFIDISPDGRFVATGTWGGTGVWIWDARTGKLLHQHPTKSHAAVAFSPDGRWLMTGGDEYHAISMNSWTNVQLVRPFTGEYILGMMEFSPDGSLLAIFKNSTSYELIEPGTWRSVAVLQSPYPIGLAWPRFSRDGTLLAAADTAFGVQIWDLRELRAALRPMGLDWDHSPYPPAASNTATQSIAAEVLTR